MRITKIHMLLAQIALLTAATCLDAQDDVRESGPQLFFYDELVQLSSDQEMNPQLAEKLRLITTSAHRQRAHRSDGLCIIELSKTPKAETAVLGSIGAETLWKKSAERCERTAHAVDRVACR